jgi:rhodanese-related sulfurtransferase
LGACGGQAAPPPAAPAAVDLAQLPQTIDVATAGALLGREDVVLLDVREQDEYDAGHIPGVRLIPLGQVAERLAEIPRDKTVVVTCRSGNRSAQAAAILRQQGYTRVHNMEGGFAAWEQAGLPVER